SLNKFLKRAAVLSEHRAGQAEVLATHGLGPGLVFGRLWERLGIPKILGELLRGRKFGFPVERAIFLTVLHRLMTPASGTSDRAAEQWRADYVIAGVAKLELHQLYRAMAWLGSPLPKTQQRDATPFAPRCTKDLIEEALFLRQRDLFSDLSLVFFDTTSIYFEGQGGETLGRHGHSKDHRPDLKQMIVGVVISGDGRPVCSELWPGNTTDVKTLLPVVTRLRKRFGIARVCVVADRGMISRATIAAREACEGVTYILGARLRSDTEVRDTVLSWGGRYQQVHGPREHSKSPAPLLVKDVRFTGEDGRDRRYVVCHNPEQAEKDHADRAAIVAALEDQLRQGDKSLVGNRGFREYLKSAGQRFAIDRAKVRQEARFDGKWVLRTDWQEGTAAEVALRYKDLWMVEDIFRTTKSVLETRPIYHKCDETIRGHVFCSFLALVLRKDLQTMLADKGWVLEWADVLRDLEQLRVTTLRTGASLCELRSMPRGAAGKALAAAGVSLGPSVRFIR
ncbi:MAG: IS1634 family transposase, partial [Planctomycetes bacterium]|nr:IS1634 family transposase [Planctomycetota bacterium]